jgi:group I intron endonuclease
MGIYVIENIETGDEYVGSSSDISNRIRDHINRLRQRKHHNQKLQNSFSKHGNGSFRWCIIETVIDESLLYEREQSWIDLLNPKYNILKNTITNRKPTGILFSPEHKQKLKDAWTEERRLAWSEYKKGKSSYNKGKKMSTSMGDKLSISKSGRISPIRLLSSGGEIYEFYNLNRFCNENGLERRKMRWLLFGRRANKYNYKGWKVLEA